MPHLISEEHAQRLFQRLIEEGLDESQPLGVRLMGIYRVVEGTYRQVVREEKRFFQGLFSMQAFTAEKYAVPEDLQAEWEVLRKICRQAARSLEFSVKDVTYWSIVREAAACIHYFSEVDIPEELEQASLLSEDLPLSQPRTYYQQIPALRISLAEVGERIQDAKGNHFCTLKGRSDDPDIGKVEIRLWDIPSKTRKGEDRTIYYSEMGTWLWKYATIQLFDLELIDRDQAIYSTTRNTQVVLEPDFLIDATEVAECFQSDRLHGRYANHRLALLRRMTPFTSSAPAFRGTIVNEMLDALIQDPRVSTGEIYKQTLRRQILTSVALGGDALLDIRTEIDQFHVRNLQWVLDNFEEKETRIEPTFYSAEYGLQGRLDALVESEVETDAGKHLHREIFELKAGSVPYRETWPSHQMQLVAYHLLLRSVYGKKGIGTASIFYSKAEQEPLRNAIATRRDVQQFLVVRNQIVRDLYELAANDDRALKDIHPDRFGPVPAYSGDSVRHFGFGYDAAIPPVKAYLQQFLGFILRELQAAKVGEPSEFDQRRAGFSALWKQGRIEKDRSYQVIRRLRFELEHPESKTLRFHFDSNTATYSLRAGDIVLLYPEDREGLFPLKYEILKAVIQEMGADYLVLSLRNPLVDHGFLKASNYWVVEQDFMDNTFRDLMKATQELMLAPEAKQRMFLGMDRPRLIDPPSELASAPLPFSPLDSQRAVIMQALRARDFCLIQGPPGTGKTSTVLAGMVDHLHRTSSETVVVLAFTNRAVSEIAQKLASRHLSFLQIGGHDSPYGIDRQTAGKNYRDCESLVKGTRIYLSTIASFLSRKHTLIRPEIRLGTLIVDEASQLLDPHLAGIWREFERVILIGDQNQLPSVTLQGSVTSKTDAPELNELGFGDMRVSLFQRLWDRCKSQGWDHATTMLTEHFRMHDQIAQLVNRYYGDALKSKLNSQCAPKLAAMGSVSSDLGEKLLTERVVFIPSPHDPMDKCHELEAIRVAALLKAVRERYGHRFDPLKTVGVITPWRAQINTIKSLIHDEQLLQVQIDTVERFQGAEREVVILSLAVNSPLQMGMLSSLTTYEGAEVDRKLNVALSRAKEQVIILGDPSALAGSPHYQAVIDATRRPDHAWANADIEAWFEPYLAEIQSDKLKDLI
ncbi:AAA domain-containing protein [Pontibacter sp. G13]|uniref:DEAD/DEAH box helicase n=1 Tax=Pontibacter sp. G13 TaxID=3074898 RepID=UPI0028899E15|nr:AAA domain-containing protein [Pontibacter sp. G13]WNJ18142.1 AAA domain-containing protein [Pontibacter sp. G13]